MRDHAISSTGPVIDRLYGKAVAGRSGCIIWTGHVRKDDGYGSMGIAGRTRLVHRVAYELMVGPIPSGLVVDHTCHNRDLMCGGELDCLHRRCINPHHLEAVTNGENGRRSRHTLIGKNVRKTHCPKDHEFTPENTRTGGHGERVCRECEREYRAELSARLRAAGIKRPHRGRWTRPKLAEMRE